MQNYISCTAKCTSMFPGLIQLVYINHLSLQKDKVKPCWTRLTRRVNLFLPALSPNFIFFFCPRMTHAIKCQNGFAIQLLLLSLSILTLHSNHLVHWVVMRFLWSSELKGYFSCFEVRFPVSSVNLSVSCRITIVGNYYKYSPLQFVRCSPSISWPLLIFPNSCKAVGLRSELKPGNKIVNSFISFFWYL